MSLLITIDTNPDFAPKTSVPDPERLISGDPSFKTWAQDSSKGEKMLTGVWEATPGETHSMKGTTFEFCHIISGVVEIEEKGGETKTYRAGDSFVMKSGFVGVWRTVETVRQIYVCALVPRALNAGPFGVGGSHAAASVRASCQTPSATPHDRWRDLSPPS